MISDFYYYYLPFFFFFFGGGVVMCETWHQTKPGSMRGKDLCRVILLDDGFGFIRFTSKGR